MLANMTNNPTQPALAQVHSNPFAGVIKALLFGLVWLSGPGWAVDFTPTFSGTASESFQILNLSDDTLPVSARGFVMLTGDGSAVVRDTSQLSACTYCVQLYVDMYYAQAYGGYHLTSSFKETEAGSALTLTPSNLNFAGQTRGTSSAVQSLTLSNTSGVVASINSISTRGDFALGHDCPASLAANAQCGINVNFTPASLGSLSGAVLLTVNGIASSVPLTGLGLANEPAWSVVDSNHVSDPRLVNLNLVFSPKVADRTGFLQLFVAGMYQDTFYFVTLDNQSQRIVPYVGGTLPAYVTVDGSILASQSWAIGLGNLSSLSGLQIYAGYGLSGEHMLANGLYMPIFRVP
jgi:hypothetical protein